MAVQAAQDGFYYRQYDVAAQQQQELSGNLRNDGQVPFQAKHVAQERTQVDVSVAPVSAPAARSTSDAATQNADQASSANPAPSASRPSRTEDEVLQLIVDLRERVLRSQQKSEAMQDFRFPNGAEAAANPASSAQTQANERMDAGPRPSSAGATETESLDLSQRRIAQITDAVVDAIKDDTVRLALASNRLMTLPPSFSGMQRLRYLNVRSNSLTEIPAVVCELPSLEILDVSRNLLRALPEEAGTLVTLRVLAINSNRIKRLPVWISKMQNLRTAKFMPNPIRWPPAEIMRPAAESAANIQKAKDPSLSAIEKERLRRTGELAWIAQLQSWLTNHADESAANESRTGGSGSISGPEGSAQETTSRNNSGLEPVPREVVPGRSAERREPSPTKIRGEDRTGLLVSTRSSTATHMRTSSHSVGQQNPALPQKGEVILKNKKSLPDLRERQGGLLHEQPMYHAGSRMPSTSRIQHERVPSAGSSAAGEVPERFGVDGAALPKRINTAARRPPLPLQTSQSPGQKPAVPNGATPVSRRPSFAAPIEEDEASPIAPFRASPSTYTAKEPPAPAASSGSTSLRKLILASSSADSKKRPDATDPHTQSAQAEAEKNSYFRRLSMLPPSTISKAVPQAVLHVVDGTRGVLYALSQIHTALKQYIMFAVIPATTASGALTDDGRVSAPVNRVLNIASESMAHFIDALDRFDSMCRRGTPHPSIVRDVFAACKDSVQIFRKTTGVLQLQLRAFLNTADVRYTRTLLLMLHGSMAEVSHSYLTIAPQIEALMPYLSGVNPSNAHYGGINGVASSSSLPLVNGTKPGRGVGGHGHAPAGSTFSTPSLPSIAEQASPGKTRPVTNAHRLARNRHAGNFSAKDVEQGAMIAPALSGSASSNGTKVGQAPSNMELLINEEKRRLEAAANGHEEYGALPLPPLPLSEISVHLSGSVRSRSGSGTGSEAGQLLSASSSTASGNFDTVSSTGVQGPGSFRRQAPPSNLGTLPSIGSYPEGANGGGFPRSPGGRPIMLAAGNGFGPRRGEPHHASEDSNGGEGRRGYFDHSYSRSMPSRPTRRGRTGSTVSVGSTGANSAGNGWNSGGQPPLPTGRPSTAGGNANGSAHHHHHQNGGTTTPKTTGSVSGRKERERERERPPVADDHLLMLTEQLTSTASGVWVSLGSHIELAVQQQEVNEAQQQQSQQQQQPPQPQQPANGGPGNAGGVLSRRMRDLNGQLTGAGKLTTQLRATLDTIRSSLGTDAGGGKVPDSGVSTMTSTNVIKQPASEIQKLWEDGNVLVRTVVQISTLVRGITSEHEFPRDVLRALGELTSLCSQLMVHMHFLAPGRA